MKNGSFHSSMEFTRFCCYTYMDNDFWLNCPDRFKNNQRIATCSTGLVPKECEVTVLVATKTAIHRSERFTAKEVAKTQQADVSNILRQALKYFG